ncbi:hypoxanthine phosphoribosyltransferase [Candidatus Bipolaricaulota bacterium]|jgi:hypoxanthine phosphoribosyltransferase|nr:hypoxanthine phosphoribosyltransferase [Candidatus Bipolaricaulota bacterium]TFH11164.1 MAG: hypoxanthine phosphoribosyltransferase [Candidatus Atribacteria bacterium]
MSSLQFEDRMSRILYPEDVIQRRVRELADQITTDYTQKGLAKDSKGRPLLLVGVLRGALVFMTDLARRFPIPVEYDLISVSSYGNGTAPGAVRLVKDLEKPIEGRDVLLVEDIIDTGYTIEYLRRSFTARNPASFRVCTLVDKVVRREAKTIIDYAGFALEVDEFIVGYGMDYAELYRNLPYVGILKPEYIG